MPETHPFISGKWQNNILPRPTAPSWFINNQSFAYAPNENIQSLFLGTFPTYEVVNFIRHNGNMEFFYGSKENSFWPLLAMINGHPTNTENDLLNLLNETNFGVTDILKKINRKGQNSSDKDLTALEFNNLYILRNSFHKIQNIFTTSGGKSPINNGTNVSAAKWLRDSLLNFGYDVEGFNVQGYQKSIRVLQNGNMIWQFNLINLWSPSDNSNISIQGTINITPALLTLINEMPAPYNEESITIRARIIQWSFLLSQKGFPVNPEINDMLNNNHEFLDNLFH